MQFAGLERSLIDMKYRPDPVRIYIYQVSVEDSIDGLEILLLGHTVIPYLVEEGYNDPTLIDT